MKTGRAVIIGIIIFVFLFLIGSSINEPPSIEKNTETENAEVTEEVNKIIEDKKVETLNLKNLKNITDEERDQNETYLTIMYDNLEEIKKELYKN